MLKENLNKDIGTAKDNQASPIHDRYRFTAGFSYKLVDQIIDDNSLTKIDTIYESFAGCGTTLVSAQKKGVQAVGNEGQELLYDVINAKLNWNIDKSEILSFLEMINSDNNRNSIRNEYHDLLKSLYNDHDLYSLYQIKNTLANSQLSEESNLFLKLSLTQTLHKCSIHPIAVPYISRSRTLANNLSASQIFQNTVKKMLTDLDGIESKRRTSQIFYHDSRKENNNIASDSCSICITSPPYLNNLDYGEVSKVCSHFFDITSSFSDITEKVRKNLVTGATTHYKEKDFDIDKWKKNQFYQHNKVLIDGLDPKIKLIEEESKKRKGKKSFHILALYYFEDMYKVLVEMKRVLKPNGKAYLVLGDSAPYGVFIDTTKILGEIGLNVGFKKFKIVKIRERGTKWKTLRFRHNLKLSENILILE